MPLLYLYFENDFNLSEYFFVKLLPANNYYVLCVDKEIKQ